MCCDAPESIIHSLVAAAELDHVDELDVEGGDCTVEAVADALSLGETAADMN